ncbi:hypothetical protein [Leptospira bouyouniensis]|uniref:hypothetical protein n=1 Tax=Leptospira bouyouniensis TaxID=2484911 RepID=UPI00109155DD|nr:hypothetical protein [Leptospira bouyouniensis]TGM74770.1 hypothetical protein EHQ99_17500 [Leptospira bouyouniensis]
MSLSKIYQDLMISKNDLDKITFEEHKPQQNQMRISNLSNLRSAFIRLREFDNGLNSIITNIESQYSHIVMYSEKSFVSSFNLGTEFRNAVFNLKNVIQTSIILLSNYVETYDEPENHFVISYPDKVSIEEYIDLLTRSKRAFIELQKATEQNAELTIDSAEKGSLLLIIFTTTTLSVVIGRVMQLVIRWRKEKREQERHLKQMERYQLETDNVKKLSEIYIGAQEKILTKLCEEFLTEYNTLKPENLIAIKQSVKDFDELIERKVRILPLPQPSKISAEFPSVEVYDNPDLIDSVKQIVDSKPENE